MPYSAVLYYTWASVSLHHRVGSVLRFQILLPSFNLGNGIVDEYLLRFRGCLNRDVGSGWTGEVAADKELHQHFLQMAVISATEPPEVGVVGGDCIAPTVECPRRARCCRWWRIQRRSPDLSRLPLAPSAKRPVRFECQLLVCPLLLYCFLNVPEPMMNGSYCAHSCSVFS